IFLLTAYIVSIIGFEYHFYLGLSLILGIISSIYQLAYQAWFPDLIPLGHEAQGDAVSSSIYPTNMIVMSPVSANLDKTLSISTLLISIGILTIIAATFELCIATIHKGKIDEKFSFQDYKSDIVGGFKFLKEEKGIRNIYSYMSITNGSANGFHLMVQAYFQ